MAAYPSDPGWGAFLALKKKNSEKSPEESSGKIDSGKNSNTTGPAGCTLKTASIEAYVFSRKEARDVREKGIPILKETGKMAVDFTLKEREVKEE